MQVSCRVWPPCSWRPALLCLAATATPPVASAARGKKKKAKKPCRGNRTPGYVGVCKAPKTAPAPPRPPVALGVNAREPETVVDAAGTAHIVWNQDGGPTGRTCCATAGSSAGRRRATTR